MKSETNEPSSAGKPDEHPVVIHIDKQQFKAPNNPMTGSDLKQLGGVPANYDLWKKVPGSDDVMISDNVAVDLKNGDHFYSAPSSLNPGSA